MRGLVLLLLLCLAVNGALGWRLHAVRPDLGVFPPVPTDAALAALSFGDPQFLYRSLVLQVQNAGDTGGRFMPMLQYKLAEVLAWLGVLQHLDPQSQHYTALAVRYYSQLRRGEDLRALVSFVDRDVDLAPDRKWYWQTQVVAIARDHLKDMNYALALSRKLDSFAPYVPEGMMWVLQVEPVLLENLGRIDEAREVMDRVVARHGHRFNEYEWRWTKTFYERLSN